MVSVVDSGIYCLVHLGKNYRTRIFIFHPTSPKVDYGAAQTFVLLSERICTEQCFRMSAVMGHAVCSGGGNASRIGVVHFKQELKSHLHNITMSSSERQLPVSQTWGIV